MYQDPDFLSTNKKGLADTAPSEEVTRCEDSRKENGVKWAQSTGKVYKYYVKKLLFK